VKCYEQHPPCFLYFSSSLIAVWLQRDWRYCQNPPADENGVAHPAADPATETGAATTGSLKETCAQQKKHFADFDTGASGVASATP
jgi:hypothetical protein